MTQSRTTLSRYWETVRWLKPVQLYGRVWFTFSRPKIDNRPAPHRRHQTHDWISPARRRASLVGPGRFMFLNVEGDLSDIDWDGPQREKLWRYNQHYFDDLNASNAGQRETWHSRLLKSWLDQNPPSRGTGWEPYPLSLRIVNWIKWVLGGGISHAGIHE